MIVEDEPLQRMSAADMLEDAGFQTIEAANSRQALMLLESRSDVRVILSDIDMPPGMNGMELVAAVRDRWPPIALVLMSGQLPSKNVKIPKGGLFFSKPYRPAELIAAITRLAA